MSFYTNMVAIHSNLLNESLTCDISHAVSLNKGKITPPLSDFHFDISCPLLIVALTEDSEITVPISKLGDRNMKHIS